MTVTINGSAGVTTNSGAVYNGLQTSTAVTASGTSVEFTGIPSWVKRVTVMMSSLSTNSTNPIQIQLGDSGGYETTGYLSTGSYGSTAGTFTSSTVGFIVDTTGTTGAAIVRQAVYTFYVLSGNTIVGNGVNNATNVCVACAGSKTLSDTLTQLRIIGSTTGSPTDTFDAGTINIIYE
jgi:hypothetical protein